MVTETESRFLSLDGTPMIGNPRSPINDETTQAGVTYDATTRLAINGQRITMNTILSILRFHNLIKTS